MAVTVISKVRMLAAVNANLQEQFIDFKQLEKKAGFNELRVVEFIFEICSA